MTQLSVRRILKGAALLSLLAMASCSDSATPAGTGSTAPLVVLFPVAYSAFDGKNSYKLPAMVDGLTAGIAWTASDPKLVDLAPLADGQVQVTMKAAGSVKIIATAGARTGATKLTILEHTPEEYKAGLDRYTKGSGAGNTGAGQPCANCHGETGIQHSPQQTGGFTEDELRDIIRAGKLPQAIVDKYGENEMWHQLHQWSGSESEITGLVVFLRSLAPKSQGAKIDFGRGSPEFAK